ncbi:MAG: hypothetical protein RJA96_1161 [Actinomycetota bacterium]|jgi:uncharacterized protein (DUF1800 family)
MNTQRLELSRLYHRFGFGPRPGQFAQATKRGAAGVRKELLTPSTTTVTAPPEISDLGPRPKPNTPEVIDFAVNLRQQRERMMLWWMDEMVASSNPVRERATWFWHGHWATAISKVDFARPMFIQNQTLRTNALGDFRELAQAMLQDCALQFWLDGQVSTAKAPNENLAREFMELFTLGVNRYSEDDVKALSKVFTGFQINLSAGTTSFNLRRHDNSIVNLLGTSKAFTPQEAVDLLVQQPNCGVFLRERIWYRFISSTEPMPTTFASSAAISERNFVALLSSAASDSAMINPKYGLVKSPVDWFVASCRALELTPSKLDNYNQLVRHLDKLGQVPFNPPNVGGWPAGESWISSASAQYRIAFASWLVKQSTLQALRALDSARLVAQSADWLGVAEWSPRTQAALRNAQSDLEEFAVLALCSPEYVVSA